MKLRRFDENDIDAVFAYQSREGVTRNLLYEPRTREQVAETIARRMQATAVIHEGDYLVIAIELPEVGSRTSALIGDVSFEVKSIEHLTAEIGWVLHPDFQHKGYAAEAVSAVLELAFGTIGLHRIFAELDPRNDASVKLCTRLGMRKEAHFVKDMMFRGEWADTGVHAILAEEWCARQEDRRR